VASLHLGEWLSAWISIGGALSALGLLNTLLCTAARVAASSARLSVLPAFLAVEDAHGVPRRATLAISALLAGACALPFAQLVSISMLFYGATTAFEFVSLVALRYTEASTPRPYRIPLPNPLLAAATALPLRLCALVILLAPREALIFFVGSSTLATITYFLAHGCERRALRQVALPLRRLLKRLRARASHSPRTLRPAAIFGRSPYGVVGSPAGLGPEADEDTMATELAESAPPPRVASADASQNQKDVERGGAPDERPRL
jgi:amino acid transporter